MGCRDRENKFKIIFMRTADIYISITEITAIAIL